MVSSLKNSNDVLATKLDFMQDQLSEIKEQLYNICDRERALRREVFLLAGAIAVIVNVIL